MFRSVANFAAATYVTHRAGLTLDHAAADETAPVTFVDTNVSLFRWPFRRLPLDDTGLLVNKLRNLGFSRAWAGTFEGLLHRDLAGANRRLVELSAKYPELVPIGAINLALPGWQSDLRDCIETHELCGVRLHPNYHGYSLEDPRFGELLRRTSGVGMFVQIASAMEDPRTQHPLVRASDVDLSPLVGWMETIEGARVQVLGHRLRGAALSELGSIERITLDTSRVEGTDGIARLVDELGADRVMYGSHAPFLIPESALIRVYESRLQDSATLSVMKTTAESYAARLPAQT